MLASESDPAVIEQQLTDKLGSGAVVKYDKINETYTVTGLKHTSMPQGTFSLEVRENARELGPSFDAISLQLPVTSLAAVIDFTTLSFTLTPSAVAGEQPWIDFGTFQFETNLTATTTKNGASGKVGLLALDVTAASAVLVETFALTLDDSLLTATTPGDVSIRNSASED